MGASVMDILANVNPSGFALHNQQAGATLAGTQAQTAETGARTSQIGAMTTEQELKNQQIQQDLRDQELLRQIYARAGAAAIAQSRPAAAAPAPVSQDITPGLVVPVAAGRPVPAAAPFPAVASTPAAGIFGADPTTIGLELARAGGNGRAVQAALARGLSQKKEWNNLTEQQQKIEATTNQFLQGKILGYLQTPPEQQAAAWPMFHDELIAAEPALAAHLPPVAKPATANDLAYVMGVTKANEALAGQAKTKAETEEAAAKGQEAAAGAALHTTEQGIKAGQLAGMQGGLLPEEQVRQKEAEARIRQEQLAFAETQRHNISDEGIHRLSTAVAQGRLAQEQMVNGMKYGPGTQQYWVKQLQDNPDSIAEMPAELRSTVGKGFTEATGLPLPTKVGEAAKTQETAARNALDGATFIQKALQNPEIRANLGPIMGRLGLAEQTLGSAPQLSPEASALAQELRTRMRYFVFQEGKAILGGRLPQQLMMQLESSSPNPTMDPAMLEGALNGAAGNAKAVMENVDKQRFGGQARPAAMRHAATSGAAALPQGGGKPIDKTTARQFYAAAGNDPAKAQKLAEDNGWKVE